MMQTYNDIERMFNDEVRHKKRIASNVHHKTGKNGYVGNMKFPTDFMGRSEKMKYRRAGKVVTTNIFDTILPIEDFEKLETYEQRNRLQYWRNEKPNKEIVKGMGISNKRFYDLVNELELPKAKRVNSDKPRKATATKKTPTPKIETDEKVVPVVQEQPQVQQIMIDGLNLVFCGTYNAEQIQKALTKFSLLVEDETDDFYLELRLMQKQK